MVNTPPTGSTSGTPAGGTTPPKIQSLRTDSPRADATETRPVKADVKNLSFYYGSFKAVKNVSLGFYEKAVTALIGPSGCGKTTLLRCFNRMHDLYPGNRYEGAINLHPSGVNIVGPHASPIEMRMRVSMVFQKPNPFPKSIFENVAYGLRLRGVRSRAELEGRVEQALRGAALWEEAKDRLRDGAYSLSGGQQQRLCIARALAVEPEIVLFDEPTSALDPIATGKIEELIEDLRTRVTILIVTHNMQQASRVSDYTAFMYLGEVIEYDRTAKIFTNPAKPLTEQYISGRFG
ncbi:MAG: phosphate ABC transporter ATP-binding protein PstB [Phycisphaerales bacterium]